MPLNEKTKNLLGFFQNANIVILRDEREFDFFRKLLIHYRLVDLLPPTRSYGSMINLIKGNPNPTDAWDGRTLYAECQIGKEEIGIHPLTDRAVGYGYPQLTVDDLI